MNKNLLLEKITKADFNFYPFKYLYIENFIPKKDFQEIINYDQVLLKEAENDTELIDILQSQDWEAIHFPGSTTDIDDYISWRKKESNYDNVNTCEGFGITFRLKKTKSGIIQSYLDFFKSESFIDCLCKKFDINKKLIITDSGFQKYLDGYEISPHPDVRKKAFTFMLNVNPNPKSEKENHHAHFCEFKTEKNYIKEYWKGNKNADRSWVPWDWCNTKFVHNVNNSITLFSPDDDTMHAVKAKYNHLKYQRTQFYGNFWYKDKTLDYKPSWHDFVIKPTEEIRTKKNQNKRISRKKLFN